MFESESEIYYQLEDPARWDTKKIQDGRFLTEGNEGNEELD
jgi:hypothetical protein